MSPTTDPSPIEQHGFTPVPASATILLHEHPPQHAPKLTSPSAIPLPNSQLAHNIRDYAEKKLPKPTFHHSMRVFYYGEAIRSQHFPSWTFSGETWLLTCLLHDIGTTPENLRATLMSFEFYGGFLALDLLVKEGATREQAEGVAEAIIRHQDLVTAGPEEKEGSMARGGMITQLGQLIQLATIFDNMGGFKELIDSGTIEAVVKEWPRLGWSKCFHDTINEENSLKPWAHTTRLGEKEFPEGVLKNQLMKPYE